MKKSELLVIKEYYKEYKDAYDYYFSKEKCYNRNGLTSTNEAKRNHSALISVANELSIISELIKRLGIDINELQML